MELNRSRIYSLKLAKSWFLRKYMTDISKPLLVKYKKSLVCDTLNLGQSKLIQIQMLVL